LQWGIDAVYECFKILFATLFLALQSCLT